VSGTNANKMIVADAYAALRDGDAKGFLGVLHPDIVVQEPEFLPYGGVCNGLEEFMEKLPVARTVVDSSRLEILALTAEDDRVAALLRVGVRDSEATVDMSEHWRLVDGKAVELRAFWASAAPSTPG
jgi:ketosteroid isomerase-like protein